MMIISHKHIKMTDIEAAYQSNSCKRYIPPWKDKNLNILALNFHDCGLFMRCTLVTNNVDTQNMTKHETKVKRDLYARNRWYSSSMADIMASIWTNWKLIKIYYRRTIEFSLLSTIIYHTIQTQEEQHEEEYYSPKLWKWKSANSFRIRYKC